MSCSGQLYNVCCRRGATLEFSAAFANADGSAIDISSWSGTAPIKYNVGDSGVLNYFTLDFSAGVSGILNYSLHRTGTLALPVSQLVYETTLYPDAIKSYEYLYGYIEVS